MKKRMIALALCLMLVVSMLGACKKAEEGTKPVDQGNKNNESEVKEEEKQITIKLGIWPEDTQTEDIKFFENAVAEFNKKYPNVTVVPANYKYAVDTFIPLAESGSLPTIFETWYTEPQKLINGEFVKDITSELKELGWDTAMNPSIRDLLSKDGKTYGIPRDGYALGMHVNVELFEEAGLVENGVPMYPKTWEELATTGQTIKEKTGSAGFVLLAMDNAGGWHFSNIAWAFGANLQVQQDGKWISQLNSAETVAAMNYIKDLKWEYDILTADPITENWGTGFQKLGTGAAAMYIGAQDAVGQPTQVNGLPVDKLSLVPLPAGPGGQYSLMGGTPYMFAADATSDEVTAALNFLEFIGRAPIVTDEAVQALKDGAQNNSSQGIPVIPGFPAWVDEAYLKAQDDVVKEYSNVDMKLFDDYYNAIKKEGNLRQEEPMLAQEMYGELTKVLQSVVTDKNADASALLENANANFQAMLDKQVNN